METPVADGCPFCDGGGERIIVGSSMKARRISSRIVEIRPLGDGLARVDLEGPDLARGAACGCFAMVEVPGGGYVLPRPYSLFLTVNEHRVALLVKNMGRGSAALLASQPGDELAVLSPLGNEFPDPVGSCWAIAGGVGAAPFGYLAAREGVEIIFGAQDAGQSGFAGALEDVGASVELATLDGSAGFKGTVVDCLLARLENDRPDMILSCGPTGMMQAVAAVAREHGIACHVSLEARMGCGWGVCRGCVHRDASGGWRCICEDGPVYAAADIFAAVEPVKGAGA